MTQLTVQQHIWICLQFARDNNAAEVRRCSHAHVSERPALALTTISKKFHNFTVNAILLRFIFKAVW